jgi:DNA adenine methylase
VCRCLPTICGMMGHNKMTPAVTEQPTTSCAPFLRWAGSKRRLLPILQTFWTKKHKRYLEPFVGSACLFFAIEPPKAILGDLNRELIATYVEVKYRMGALLRELEKLRPASRREYKRLRSIDISTLSRPARAARFIYLNRFCFNGIYRTNLLGQFNVPYSGDRCGNVPSEDTFRKCSRGLQNARFMSGDFDKVLREATKGDFVYMDPPFVVRARRIFREYDPGTFTHEDIARLRSWMKRLQAGGIKFVVSYAESDEADALRKGFSYETVSVRRHIAGFAANRTLTNELLISNI